MSRGNSMSGANNIPLGSRRDGRDGTLAQAAASLSGTSLLNPDYLLAASGSSSGSSSGSKFGPIACKLKNIKNKSESQLFVSIGLMYNKLLLVEVHDYQ